MNILVNLYPSFPPREVLYDYILGRAKKVNVKKYIRFNTTVTNVIYNGSEFEITSLNKKNNKISNENFDKCCYRIWTLFCSLHS